MGPDSVLQAMADRANDQIDRFEGAEGALDVAENLGAGDGLISVHARVRQAGPYDIDAIEGSLGIDFVLVNPEVECVLTDVELKVLGDFVFVDDFANPNADFIPTPELALPDPFAELVELPGDRFHVNLVTGRQFGRISRPPRIHLGDERFLIASVIKSVVTDLDVVVPANPVALEDVLHPCINDLPAVQPPTLDHGAHLVQLPGGCLKLSLPQKSGQLMC